MPGRKRKLKDEAASLLRKGKYERALQLYRQVAAEDPDDTSARRNLGYILRKLGRRDEAVAVFVELANEYASEGFLLKAIATCKVVLEIDPSHTDTQKRLAELYSSRTETPTPELKVMAQIDPSGQATGGAVAPGARGLAGDALELPASEGADGAGLEIQRTTPPEQLYGMVDLGGSAEPAAAGQATPGTGPEDQIELIELEPIPLQPLDPPAPRSEPPPVVGRLMEVPAETPAAEPAEAGKESRAAEPAPAEEPPEEAPDETTEEPLPDIEIDLEFELTEPPPLQTAAAPEIPLFCDLEPEAFVTLLEKMRLVRTRPGQWILREGEAGSSMFTIASGQVRVLKRIGPRKLLQLAVLGEGAFFGEMALLRGGLRGASVQAVGSGELFEISRELIDEVARRYPAVEEVLERFAHQRLLRNAMATSPLFRPFSRKERIAIIERFVTRDVEPGEVLVEEGVESDGLYLVLRGRMEVFCRAGDEAPVVVGELGEGEVFGEISCLRKDPAIATVRVKQPGSILRLPREDFDALVLSHPQILELVSRLSDQRLAETSNLLARKGILI